MIAGGGAVPLRGQAAMLDKEIVWVHNMSAVTLAPPSRLPIKTPGSMAEIVRSNQ